MLIQCPTCRARTDLAGHHEGKRVRCTECGCVHVARPADAQGRVSDARRRRLIAASVAVIALAGFVVCTRGAQRGATAARGEAPPFPSAGGQVPSAEGQLSSAEGQSQGSIERGFAWWYKEQQDLPMPTSNAPDAADKLEPEAPRLEPHSPPAPTPHDQDD